jgi:hypothetical protein
MEKVCDLHLAVGEVEECPHGWCAFWEREGAVRRLVPSRGAVVESGCAIERMGVDLTNPDLAYYLLDLRRALEAVRDREEATTAERTFGQVRPPGL